MEALNAVSQAPEQPLINTVSANMFAQPMVPSQPVAEQRATKATMGVQGWLPQAYVSDQILNGNESGMRDNAAAKVSEENGRIKEGLITKLMAANQGPVTPEEKIAVDNLMKWNTSSDPKTVFEESYAKRFFDAIKTHAEQIPDSPWQDKSPAEREEFLQRGSEFLTKDQIANTLYEEFHQRAQNQGWAGYILDRAKEWLIPGYDVYKGQLGSTLRSESVEGYALPTEQFGKWMSDRAAALAKDNPAMAVHWLAAMRGMSNSEEALNNIFGVVGMVPTVGGGTALGIARKVAGKAQEELFIRQMAKSALKTNIREPASPAVLHEATGNIPAASAATAAAQVVKDVSGKSSIKDILDNLPGIFQGAIDNLKGNPGNLRREGVERIMQGYESAKLAVINAAANTIKVDRLPVLRAVNQTVRDLAEREASKYPEIHNTMLNASFHYEPAINGHYVDIYLGKTGDSLFTNEKTAENFISKNKLLDAVVEQQGAGFAIKVSKPLGETGYVRDILLHTEGVKTPESFLNSIIGRLRSPEDTLAQTQKEARKAAAYGPAVYERIAKDITKDVKKLGSWAGQIPFTKKRQKWLEFQKVIGSMEKEPKWFETIGDFEQYYQKSIGRLPDEQEIHAGFAWKRGEELYQTWRDLQAYKNLHRQGAQTKVISVPTLERAKSFEGFTDFHFTGKRLTKAPTTGTVMILGKTLGQEKLVTGQKLIHDKDLLLKIEKGEASLHEVINHGDQPLSGMSKATKDHFIQYVIDPDGGRIADKQLEWKQYGRRPPQYDYDHYVKQAIVKYDPISNKHLYLGDKTISVHGLSAMSADVANKLDKIREFLAVKDGLGAQRFHASSGLQQEFSEIKGWFEKGPAGEPARLSLADPIRATPRGKMLIQLNKDLDKYKTMGSGLEDIAHQGSARYLGEHYDPQDVFTYRNDGTAHNPIYNKTEVNYVNPITSLNRSLNRVASSQFMDDYKAFSVEHWIQEAGQYLNKTPEELGRSPYFYFYNAESFWKDVKGEDVFRLRNLQTSRLQIQQFLGSPDTTGAWLHATGQKLSDSLYKLGVPKVALAAEWTLPRLRDPYTFIRTMSFHSKLGLFNPAQLLVQMNTWFNIAAIAPKHAPAGASGALLYAWSQVNRHPEILQHMDKMLSTGTNLGWKPGEWLEATKFLENSGFLRVGGEQAIRDNPFKNNIVTNGGQTFLDWGSWFFNTGERSTRLGAGYTAYKEAMASRTTTGALSNTEKLKILDRADLLYGNMSRASSSRLQHGVFSIPSQFMGYQLRLTEQFLGKRLTQAERVRLFGTYAAMYGVPGAFGLSGLPSGDYFRKWAVEGGYTVGENWVNTAVTEGLPSLILGMSTGVFPGIQNRYGPTGLTPVSDLLFSDKAVWDIITGASGGQLHNLFGTMGINGSFGSMHGFWKAAISLISGDEQFPFNAEDLVEPFKEVSLVNNAWATYIALNTGKLVSKREAVVEDASPLHAVLNTLTGVKTQASIDNYLKQNIRKEEEAFQKYTLSKFTEDVRRAIMANKDGNPEQAKAFLKRARTWLDSSDYPANKRGTAWSIALQGYESMVDRGNWDWAFGDKVPPSRQQTSIQQYIATQQQKQGNK